MNYHKGEVSNLFYGGVEATVGVAYLYYDGFGGGISCSLSFVQTKEEGQRLGGSSFGDEALSDYDEAVGDTGGDGWGDDGQDPPFGDDNENQQALQNPRSF